MGFKKMRGVKLPYKKQGYIFFLCQNYDELSEDIQMEISLKCDEVAGEYSDALFAVLTTEKSISSIALQYHISESALYRYRKQFYEMWVSHF